MNSASKEYSHEHNPNSVSYNYAREKRLYRDLFKTFDDYCRQRWSMGSRRAQQLCRAGEIVVELAEANCGQLPITESQVRPLVSLSPEDRVRAWNEVLSRGVAITAEKVSEIAKSMRRAKTHGAYNPNKEALDTEEAKQSRRAQTISDAADKALISLQILRAFLEGHDLHDCGSGPATQ